MTLEEFLEKLNQLVESHNLDPKKVKIYYGDDSISLNEILDCTVDHEGDILII